jgi:hypothetical protein
MSKGKGQKIAIKFDKPLLGDVTGNESAFTISGMQRNPLGVGELELKTYTPSTVERYPVATLYEDDFTGAMDGVEIGVNGVVLERPVDDFEDNTVGNVPSGWTVQWGTGFTVQELDSQKSLRHVHTSDQRNGLAFVDAGAFSDGEIYCEIKQATGSNPNFGLVFCLGGSGGAESAYQLVNFGTTFRIGKYVNGTFTSINTATITALAVDTWYCTKFKKDGNNLYGKLWQKGTTEPDWQVTGTDSSLSSGYVGVMAFNANSTVYYDNFAINEYSAPGTYTTTIPADTLPTNPRLKWTEDLPAGTSITAEYAVNQDEFTTPETWTAVNNSDLLTIPDPATGYFLWLRFTLATTDTAVTPTLLSVWLEEAEAPPDTILLSFDTYNRFNDVEGDITVEYNQGLGTLAGTRPVESFSVDFTPTDLEPTPIDEHTITAGIDLTVDLIDLEFTEIYADHNVTHTATAGIDVTVALINIEDINP